MAPCPRHTEELAFRASAMEIKASLQASSLSYNPQRLEKWRGQDDANFLLTFLQTTLLIFLKCLIWCFLWKDWGGIRIFVLPVWISRVEAWREILWGEKFTCRIWLSCICSLLHLTRTSHGTKAAGRWAEDHPNAGITTSSLPHLCPTLPYCPGWLIILLGLMGAHSYRSLEMCWPQISSLLRIHFWHWMVYQGQRLATILESALF